MNTVFNDPDLILHRPILGVLGERLSRPLLEITVRVLSVAKCDLESPLKFLGIVLGLLEFDLDVVHSREGDSVMLLKSNHAGLESGDSLVELCSLPILLTLAEWAGRLLTFRVCCGTFARAVA